MPQEKFFVSVCLLGRRWQIISTFSSLTERFFLFFFLTLTSSVLMEGELFFAHDSYIYLNGGRLSFFHDSFLLLSEDDMFFFMTPTSSDLKEGWGLSPFFMTLAFSLLLEAEPPFHDYYLFCSSWGSPFYMTHTSFFFLSEGDSPFITLLSFVLEWLSLQCS